MALICPTCGNIIEVAVGEEEKYKDCVEKVCWRCRKTLNGEETKPVKMYMTKSKKGKYKEYVEQPEEDVAAQTFNEEETNDD